MKVYLYWQSAAEKKQPVATLMLVLLLLLSFSSTASPLQNMPLIGQGKMSWMFWDLYNAQYYRDDEKQALKLEYLRDIKAKDLIQATEEQWQHIELSNPSITDWLKQVTDIWPELNQGDSLLLLVDSNGASEFQFKGRDEQTFKSIGHIKDVEFGPAFLAIWLSPRTSEPKLRKQLLGKQ